MMNHHHPQPHPAPACAAVAPLLERAVAQQRLDRQDEDTLQTHLETCEYCCAELESYQRLDDALARHFAPPTRHPLSSADISAITNQSYSSRSASPALPVLPTSTGSRRPQVPEPARRRVRGDRFFSAFSALAAAVLIAAVSLALFMSHAHSPGPGTPPTSASTTPRATVPPVSEVTYVPGPKDVLSSIYMVSATEGWAVGTSFVGSGVAGVAAQRDTIILHYTGGLWKRVMGVPDNQQLQASITVLSQVVMVSATEGWAVGNFEAEHTQEPFGLILHYTGGRWTVQQLIAHGYLTSLALTSASDGWAVGGTQQSAQSQLNQSLLLHYDGHSWTSVQAPGQVLLSIAMTSPTDGWIIGSTPGSNELGNLLLRYNGSGWSQTPLPSTLSYVTHISPVSAADVWASGGARNADVHFSGGGQMAFVHYDGKTWTTVQTPIAKQNANISSLFMDASNDGWAVGWVNVSQVLEKTIYLHYTGGQWIEVNGPGHEVHTLFMLSTSEGWAVGDNKAILHYSNGAWNFVVSPGQ